jgi:hypothetical protein
MQPNASVNAKQRSSGSTGAVLNEGRHQHVPVCVAYYKSDVIHVNVAATCVVYREYVWTEPRLSCTCRYKWTEAYPVRQSSSVRYSLATKGVKSRHLHAVKATFSCCTCFYIMLIS